MANNRHINTTLAVIVAGVAILYVSLPYILELALKSQLNPPDNEIGQIINARSYEELLNNTDGGINMCTGKKALVVGGTRGIGYGTALALAQAGCSVTIVGRSETSGVEAVSRIQREIPSSSSSSSSDVKISYLAGDLGTVASTKALVDLLASLCTSNNDENNRDNNQGDKNTDDGDDDGKFDYLVASAAIFPNTSDPEPINQDGIEKSFAIAVVGRFILYHDAHRFLKGKNNARILNILAPGTNYPMTFHREPVRSLKGLVSNILNFGIGNEIMLHKLIDEHYNNNNNNNNHNNPTTFRPIVVSTHPGNLKTDLHRGQGLLFDLLESFIVHFAGISEEECGQRQASILLSDKKRLHAKKLSIVDSFGHGRLKNDDMERDLKEHGDWLWDLLTKLNGDGVQEEKYIQ